MLSVNKFQLSSCGFFSICKLYSQSQIQGSCIIVCGKMRHKISSHRVDKHRGRDVNKSPKIKIQRKTTEWNKSLEAFDPFRDIFLRETPL